MSKANVAVPNKDKDMFLEILEKANSKNATDGDKLHAFQAIRNTLGELEQARSFFRYSTVKLGINPNDESLRVRILPYRSKIQQLLNDFNAFFYLSAVERSFWSKEITRINRALEKEDSVAIERPENEVLCGSKQS